MAGNMHNILDSGKICVRSSSFALCPICDEVVDLQAYDHADDPANKANCSENESGSPLVLTVADEISE